MSAPELVLLTLTRDRPGLLALCERWVRRMNLPTRSVDWLVVDDGIEPAKVTVGRTLRLGALADPLLAALEHPLLEPCGQMVLMVGDERWYHRDYAAMLCAAMVGAGAVGVDMVGQAPDRLYHWTRQTWREGLDKPSAVGLSRTGWVHTPRMADSVRVAATDARACGDTWTDLRLWGQRGMGQDGSGRRLFSRRRIVGDAGFLSMGMKGIPGTTWPAIPGTPGRRWQLDRPMTRLQEWVGLDDLRAYMETFGQPAESTGSA